MKRNENVTSNNFGCHKFFLKRCKILSNIFKFFLIHEIHYLWFIFRHISYCKQKMGIPSSAICFYCYGFKVQIKARFGLATLPCETYFSGNEFLSSILSNHGEIIPTANQVPSVDGFGSTWRVIY